MFKAPDMKKQRAEIETARLVLLENVIDHALHERVVKDTLRDPIVVPALVNSLEPLVDRYKKEGWTVKYSYEDRPGPMFVLTFSVAEEAPPAPAQETPPAVQEIVFP